MYQSTDNDTKKASYFYIFASKKAKGALAPAALHEMNLHTCHL